MDIKQSVQMYNVRVHVCTVRVYISYTPTQILTQLQSLVVDLSLLYHVHVYMYMHMYYTIP